VTNIDRLGAAIRRSRQRAARFLQEQVSDVGENRYWRLSSGHRLESGRSHLLYGTWSGALASVLLQGDVPMDAGQRRRIGNALNGFQLPNGTYVMPDIPAAARPTHDDEYFAFHCTNYALGALRAVGQAPRYPLSFLDAFRSRGELERWLSRRDWSHPWMEGNNVVNLASFYGVAARDGAVWARERLVDLADWHDRNQDPKTGFWHASEGTGWRELHNAMAGAAHNLHIYYLLERDVPRPTVIVDSCLRLGYMGIRSACLDIDFVDILVNLRRYGHRVDEIDRILGKYLVELLQVQQPDGGFCDNYVTPSDLYGYVTGADVSLTWATWFRLATIGMLACVFRPQDRNQWVFRETVGMGYFNVPHALGSSPAASRATDAVNRGWLRRAWLAAVRRGRFIRHRLTWSIRQRVAS
jgi:hypothetical protein